MSQEDLHIEDRIIPGSTVARFRQFMENVRQNRCGEQIHFGFPSSGTYHDLVRVYYDEFRRALEENISLRSLTVFIEQQEDTDLDEVDLWQRIGVAVASAPGMREVVVSNSSTENFDVSHICAFLRNLNVQSIHLEFPTLEDATTISGTFALLPEDLSNLSHSLSGLTKLQNLRMNDTYLVGTIDPLFSRLQQCTNLRTIDLVFDYEYPLSCESNHLEDFLRHSNIDKVIFHCVRYLEDKEDEIHESFANQLANGVAASSSLRFLNLSLRNFHAFTPKLIAALNGSNIEVLELPSGFSAMFADPATSLYNLLHNNRRLRTLKITIFEDPEDIECSMLAALGNALGEETCTLNQLTILGSLTGSSILELSKRLKDAKTLTHLHIPAFPKRRKEVREQFLIDACQNVSLHACTIDKDPLFYLVPQLGPLQAALTLNKKGRSYLRTDPTNRVRAAEIFESVNGNLDCLYFHLLENPSFVANWR